MSQINRLKRIRQKIKSRADRPRLCVFRSNRFVFAQIINPDGKSVCGFFEKNLSLENKKLTKTEKARLVGEKIAKMALAKNIKEVVFDRSGYKYHGRVKALAEGAREHGLIF